MTTANGLIPVNGNDFINMQYPARTKLIDPIIAEKSINMIYATRGFGKTNFALTLAIGVACGKDMFDGRWKVSEPKKVLYLEGETDKQQLQRRIKSIRNYYGTDTDISNFHLLNPDILIDGVYMPNLATLEGQAAIEQALEGVSLVVVDNISCLCENGRENEAESWNPVLHWTLMLRRRGIAIIFVHHANKNGGQRGSNKKEDAMDIIISLKRPSDYESSQDLRCEVNFEKARGIYGRNTDPFELQMVDEDKGITWKVSAPAGDVLTKERIAKILLLTEQGISQREIGKKLDISGSKVNQLLKEYRSKETATKIETAIGLEAVVCV